MSVIKANEIRTLDGTLVYKQGETIANDSVGKLSDLLVVNPNTKAVVNVLNYHSDVEGGGGVFYWNATKPATEHNGGTVISPLAVFPTDWNNQTQLAAWFTAPTSGVGCWVRQYDGAVNVKWFGAKEGSENDSTQSFKAWSLFGENKKLSHEIVGTYYINETIVLNNYYDSVINTNCEIRNYSVDFTGDSFIQFTGSLAGFVHVGKLKLVGGSSTVFKTRVVNHGVDILASAPSASFDNIEAYHLKGFAVRSTGNSPMMKYNKIKAWQCGASPNGAVNVQAVKFNFTKDNADRTGVSGASAQSDLLTVTGIDATTILSDSWVAYTDPDGVKELFYIREVLSSDQIRVVPWLPTNVTSGELSLVQGGGYFAAGSDNSKATIGVLDVLVCGMGIRDRTLYPATVLNVISQYCGAALMPFGYNQAGLGFIVLSAYFEANFFDLFSASPQGNATGFIRDSSTLNTDKVGLIKVKHATVNNFYHSQYLFVRISKGTELYERTSRNELLILDNPSGDIAIDINEFWSYYKATIYVVYDLINVVSNFTLKVAADKTINGGTNTLLINAASNPTKLIVKRSVSPANKGRYSSDYTVSVV